MQETIIDLIRHGEPKGGRAYRGHGIDDPLSEKGWHQMRSAVGELSPWHHIVSSPMKRCHEFAQELNRKLNIPLSVDDRIKEVGFGCWEGKTADELKAERLEEYESFYRDPINNRPQGAEPLEEFMHRVSTAYDTILNTHTGKHVLVVAHAGVIRAIITHVLHGTLSSMYRIRVGNAGVSRLIHNHNGGMLQFHNVSLVDMKQTHTDTGTQF